MIQSYRLSMTTFLSLVFFVFVAGRLGYLQLYCHAALQERVNREESRFMGSTDVVPRGSILDRSGAVLALSIQGGACYADPRHVLHPDETARQLSPYLHLPVATIKAKLT